MNPLLRRVAVAKVAAVAMLCSACVPVLLSSSLPVEVKALFLGPAIIIDILEGQFDSAKRRNLTETLEITGEAGGLDGSFDFTLSGEGGTTTLGTFTGTAKVKRQRFVTVTINNTTDLKATVANLLRYYANDAAEFEVKKAKATIKSHQTPGGANKVFNGKITFTATVLEGPEGAIGKRFTGTFSAKGNRSDI